MSGFECTALALTGLAGAHGLLISLLKGNHMKSKHGSPFGTGDNGLVTCNQGTLQLLPGRPRDVGWQKVRALTPSFTSDI